MPIASEYLQECRQFHPSSSKETHKTVKDPRIKLITIHNDSPLPSHLPPSPNPKASQNHPKASPTPSSTATKGLKHQRNPQKLPLRLSLLSFMISENISPSFCFTFFVCLLFPFRLSHCSCFCMKT